MIYIITGEVRTGKSTRVYRWFENRQDVGGFVSLDDGPLRYLHNAYTREKITHQIVKTDQEEVLNIGKFTFLKSSFDSAIAWTLQQNENPDINYLVIDELGKLEVKGEGFSELIRTLLQKSEKHLVIIIRDYLYEKALHNYGIKEFTRLSKDEIDKIV